MGLNRRVAGCRHFRRACTIEMPIMDGHMLTKLIKEGRGTNRLKVVIFSSMINDATRKKGEELGADVQMTKPEIGLLVGELDKLLGVA